MSAPEEDAAFMEQLRQANTPKPLAQRAQEARERLQALGVPFCEVCLAQVDANGKCWNCKNNQERFGRVLSWEEEQTPTTFSFKDPNAPELLGEDEDEDEDGDEVPAEREEDDARCQTCGEPSHLGKDTFTDCFPSSAPCGEPQIEVDLVAEGAAIASILKALSDLPPQSHDRVIDTVVRLVLPARGPDPFDALRSLSMGDE